jgi:hypothetical protein
VAAGSAFAALPPETSFGYAPAPGAKRLLGAAQLRRMAAPHELDVAPGAEICVVRSLEPLSRERLEAAMRTSLPDAGARFEIVEFSAFGVPKGELRFPLTGLRRPPLNAPSRPVLWKGYVEYAPGRRYPVWARVVFAGKLREVERGDQIRVEAASGRATVAVTARAETSGGRGEMVVVRNPASGKRFKARVQGKGAAAVVAGEGE